MKPPDKVSFRSADGRFNLLISECRLNDMRTFCAAAHPLETGGILVGYYNCRHDTAIITIVAGPPEDSVKERTRFYRGVRGLQSILDNRWDQREYYLGEWHCHPAGSPQPSLADIRQMRGIANDVSLQCPEPILIIAGAGRTINVLVFPQAEATVLLAPTDPTPSRSIP